MQKLQFPNIVDKNVKWYTHFGRVLSVSYIVRHTYDLIILGFFSLNRNEHMSTQKLVFKCPWKLYSK